jgi:hypothetical protein
MEKIDKDEIKKILSPHFGYLEFLSGLSNNSGVEISDIKILVDFIKNKEGVVKSLPKPIVKYSSYASLIRDLVNVEKKYEIKKWIKDNLSRIPRDLVISVIDSDKDYFKKIDKIYNCRESSATFIRWSSRIDSLTYSKIYIDSIFNNWRDIDRALNDNTASKLYELKNWKDDVNLLPPSWCLTRESTFQSYLLSNRIFLLKYSGRKWGINADFELNIKYIQDDRNNSVYKNLYPEIWEEASIELERFKYNGSLSNTKSKIGKTKIFDRLLHVFKNIR